MYNLGLVDTWQLKNGSSRKYIYFSERHRSFPIIDMICILRDFAAKISKTEILPDNFSYHNCIWFIKENLVILDRD